MPHYQYVAITNIKTGNDNAFEKRSRSCKISLSAKSKSYELSAHSDSRNVFKIRSDDFLLPAIQGYHFAAIHDRIRPCIRPAPVAPYSIVLDVIPKCPIEEFKRPRRLSSVLSPVQPVSLPALRPLYLARLLRIATDNLDLIGLELLTAITLESHVLDEECPDIIAEAVGLQMTLSLV